MHDIIVLVRNENQAREIENEFPWMSTVVGFRIDLTAMKTILSKVSTKFFYVVYPDRKILESLETDFTPDEHEQQYVHVWNETLIKRVYSKRFVEENIQAYLDASVPTIKNHTDRLETSPWEVFASLEEGHAKATREYFWVIDPNVDVLDTLPRNFYPRLWNATFTHHWKRQAPQGHHVGYESLVLYPTDTIAQEKVEMEEVGCKDREFPILYVDSLSRIELGGTFGSEMTYIADPRFTFRTDIASIPYPPVYDRDKIHVWRASSGHEVLKLVPKDYNETPIKEMQEVVADFPILPITTTISESPSWILDDGFEIAPDFDLALRYSTDPAKWKDNEPWEHSTAYTFATVDRNGKLLDKPRLRLDSTNTKTYRHSNRIGARLKEFDIVYLSYNEPFADENFERLSARFPRAIRINGVKGFFEAHKVAAHAVESLMFYVVDADAIVLPEFEFDYMPDEYDYDVTHVWHSRNPINNLTYGYGGVKLFPTAALRKATHWNIDFTTSVGTGFKSIPIVSNITRFNTDEFNTWKSAFRECAKLSAKIIKNQINEETEHRLKTWQTISNLMEPFADLCTRGAAEGIQYGIANKDNPEALDKINNFEWLRQRFERSKAAHEEE
jgi:hypothetical protein